MYKSGVTLHINATVNPPKYGESVVLFYMKRKKGMLNTLIQCNYLYNSHMHH